MSDYAWLCAVCYSSWLGEDRVCPYLRAHAWALTYRAEIRRRQGNDK